MWPISRRDYPKQLQKLVGEHTLLQQALALAAQATGRPPGMIANREHRFQIRKQAEELGLEPPGILLETVGRNTAPAAIIAALHALETDKKKNQGKKAQSKKKANAPLVLLMPSDHKIEDKARFVDDVAHAAQAAEKGMIVTLGIAPQSPQTAYGYIRASEKEVADRVLSVAEFVEKPNRKTAKAYLASGNYYWNSGIFVYCARTLLEEAEKTLPQTLAFCKKALKGARRDLGFTLLDHESFGQCEDISIDYGIMEHTDRAAVLPVDFGWSDLGSWDAVWQELDSDEHGNSVKGDVVLRESENCLVMGDGRLVAGIGVKNLAIIDTPDALLVINRKKAQKVGKIVNYLKARKHPEAVMHRRTYRPWGWYEQIARGERHQVKILHIAPGQKLSVQSHNHRSEHWVVVRGTVKIRRGDETILLSENQSTYIPLGVIHNLENPGKIPAQIIEVQTGAYLGEDDIIRYDDVYGRVGETVKSGSV